jgi:RNA 3'-terminal phosphate cyclase
MLPLALAGSGRYLTMKPTGHASSNALVIREFLDVDLAPRKSGGVWVVAG